MASPPSCCGCGVLGLRSGERRSVNNSPVVMHVWRTCLEEIGINFNDFSGKELTMCRKCFSAYERLHSLKKSVADKLAHAISALVLDDIASVCECVEEATKGCSCLCIYIFTRCCCKSTITFCR